MRPAPIFCLLIAMPALQGCIVKTAADVVTAPVRVASGAVDMATTSQSEADEKRGREIRKRDEELAKLERSYNTQLQQCDAGDRRACEDARTTYAEMQRISASLPAPPPERR